MRKMITVAVLTCVMCAAGFAALTPCASATIATYLTYTTAANGCQIDDKVFFGFNDTITAAGGASATGVGITVTPVTTAFNPGLNFTLAGFSAGANSSLDLKLFFTVGVLDGGNLIEDVSLGIGGAQFSGTGLVAIGENACVGGTFTIPGAVCSSGGTPPNELSLNVQNPGPPVVFFDMKITKPTNLVGVFKDVSVTGGSAGSASLSSFTQQFSEVPEVNSILLLGTCFFITSLAFRRKRMRQDF